MKLHVEWERPLALRDAKQNNMIYELTLDKVPDVRGIYVFGRRWGTQFEALYVGKATNIRGRVKSHLNNLSLTKHLSNAKTGKRVLLTGKLVMRRGQNRKKALILAERAFIRYFLSEGHDLVNKQGTWLRRHEVESSGRHPKRFFPKQMHLAKSSGE